MGRKIRHDDHLLASRSLPIARDGPYTNNGFFFLHTIVEKRLPEVSE